MKRKVVSAVLTGIAILALSTTVAHASGGGNPVPLHSFFVCNAINGGNAGQVVDIGGAFIGPNRTGVSINFGALACAVAKLFRTGSSCQQIPGTNPPQFAGCRQGESCLIAQGASVGKCEIVPDPRQDLGELKCYNVNASPRTSASPGSQGPPTYTAEDAFFGVKDPLTGVGGETGVQDGGIQFICGPANFLRETPK